MDSRTLQVKQHQDTVYLQFPSFNDTELVNHGFSTKHGGYSKGCYSSMNLSFTRGDDPSIVDKNFRRFTDAIGADYMGLVLSDQVHKAHIRRICQNDMGKGVYRTSDVKNTDGMITNVPGITLVTFYADCVPLFFLDPVNKAIGLSHAGWRGTVAGIGPKTVLAMKEAYGTKAEDILVGIGPSIGPCCYEVSEDVIIEFEKKTNHGIIAKIAHKTDSMHYMLDLWAANRYLLMDAGVVSSNITVTDLCTKCHSEDFYSHRMMGANRGSLAGMMMLRS